MLNLTDQEPHVNQEPRDPEPDDHIGTNDRSTSVHLDIGTRSPKVLRFPRNWLYGCHLKPRALGLAVAISDWQLKGDGAGTGWCFYPAARKDPELVSLAKNLGWSERSVERAMAELRTAGVLDCNGPWSRKHNRRGFRLVPPGHLSAQETTTTAKGGGPATAKSGGPHLFSKVLLDEVDPEERELSCDDIAEVNKEISAEPPPASLPRNCFEKKKAPPSLSSTVTTTTELVADFNARAEAKGLPNRERVTPGLEKAIAETGETVEQLRPVVVGLFYENPDDRDPKQRLWHLQKRYGIASALKRLETRDRFRDLGKPVLESERLDAELEQQKEQERIERRERLRRCEAGNHDYHPSGRFDVERCSSCGELTPEAQAEYDARESRRRDEDRAKTERLFAQFGLARKAATQ